MSKVLFLCKPHDSLAESLTKLGFLCVHEPHKPKAAIAQTIHEYIGLVINSRFTLDAPFLKQARNLKFIARTGSGTDFIDMPFAEAQGIAVLTSPEGNRVAVAEHAMGMLLGLMNNLFRADQEVRRGVWLREQNRGQEIKGKTVAIIGFGNNGRAFGQRLRGFECQILAYDKFQPLPDWDFITPATPEQIYDQADIVSLHVPLTEQTQQMVNADWLNRFRKPIYLINTSRGKVAELEAIAAALKSGKLLGAALDVMETEGKSYESLFREQSLPPALAYLVHSDRAILSPHIAGWTHESHYAHAEVLIEKIRQLISRGIIVPASS